MRGWLLALIAASLTACSAPESAPQPERPSPAPAAPVDPVDYAKAQAELITKVRQLSTAYPGLEVTDIRFARGVGVACAVLREGDRPPHAAISLDTDLSDATRSVMMPFLHRPGIWEAPENQRVSDAVRKQCRSMGAPID